MGKYFWQVKILRISFREFLFSANARLIFDDHIKELIKRTNKAVAELLKARSTKDKINNLYSIGTVSGKSACFTKYTRY